MRKDVSVSEENKASAADRLGESERQISRLQRELHDLGGQRGQLQKKLQDLEQQSKELSVTLTQQQGQLEKLLYKQYLRGTPDSLQLQLNGDDPNQMARDLYYLSAIALTRAELMGEVSATLGKKKALVVDIKERADELREIEAQQQRRHAELQKQREERNALYTQVSDKVNAQRKQIGFLQQDEQRLNGSHQRHHAGGDELFRPYHAARADGEEHDAQYRRIAPLHKRGLVAAEQFAQNEQ